MVDAGSSIDLKGLPVARIQGFRVQNFRALRDVSLGATDYRGKGDILTPLTVVIGKNGVGKSSLFDAFGFLADCLATDVETACDLRQRGGFERLRSMGCQGPIELIVRYRDTPETQAFDYRLRVDIDTSGRPFVADETLLPVSGTDRPVVAAEVQLARDPSGGMHILSHGQTNDAGEREPELVFFENTDPRQLAVASLGALKGHHQLSRFREFLKGWHVSYLQPDATRGLPSAGPQRHLNARGDNIGNVVQFMQREHGARFQSILNRIAERIPGIKTIDTKVTEDNRVLLRFNDGGFQDPFYAQQMSDGTLKVFAYLLLL